MQLKLTVTVTEIEDSNSDNELNQFNEDGQSNEDNDDEDDGEDDEALFDDQEVKFKDLVSSKIDEAEKFFDDANSLQLQHRHLSYSQTVTETNCTINNEIGTQTQENENSNQDRDRDHALNEIVQLRDLRESLTSEGENWTGQGQLKRDEIQEAIDAVDLAISLKDEVVAGSGGQGQPSMSSEQAEVNLVARLEVLSAEDLQRLLGHYFSKVTELRRSSRRVERKLEHAENSNDQLRRHRAKAKASWKEIHAECQNRIRMVFASYNMNIAKVTEMDAIWDATLKREHDLGRSLTEILIRHGYLISGADYDVKQVVRMLGLKEKDKAETKQTQASSSSSSTARGGGGGGQGQRARSRHHHYHDSANPNDRAERHQQQQTQSEVRREKGRLIITNPPED